MCFEPIGIGIVMDYGRKNHPVLRGFVLLFMFLIQNFLRVYIFE